MATFVFFIVWLTGALVLGTDHKKRRLFRRGEPPEVGR